MRERALERSEGRGVGAFVHVDLVASTEFLAASGVETSMSRRRRIGEFVDRAAERHDGEVVDVRGDGTLLRFDSAVHALGAASRVQRAALADGGVGALRVGVVIDEVDDPVVAIDAASTVERQCPAGSIAFGDRVRRAVATHLPTLDLTDVAPGVWAMRPTPVDEVSGRLMAVVFTEPERTNGAVATDVDAGAMFAAEGGDVVDTNGLGHVAVFTSCRAALESARRLHSGVADLRAVASGPRVPLLRVGVSFGEVTLRDGHRVGGAVVEAARLTAIADFGTTCASDDVCALGDTENLAPDDAPAELKGLSEPVCVRRTQPVSPPALVDVPARLVPDDRYDLSGRDRELAQLRTAWSEVERGSLRAVAVSGEEGVGKTRLVAEFVRSIERTGAVAALGVCTESSGVPFAPIVDALTRLAPVSTDVERAQRGDGPLAELFGTGDSADGERRSPAGSVARTLLDIADRRPVVLVLDDVQWASGDLMGLVDGLLTDSPDMRLLLVVTCRDTDVDRDHPAHRLLTPARGRRNVERCSLSPLTTDHVAAMLGSRVGITLVGPEYEFADYLRRTSGGNPLYVEELVSHFASNGTISEVDGRWRVTAALDDLVVPDTVLGLMAERVGRLGPDVVEVLRTAAVCGESFDLDVVASVSERPLDEILDVVEAAEDARLVSEGDAGGECSFTDELVRAALLRDIRPTRRALMHRSIANTLEELAPNRIDDLARHWEASVGRDAAERAVVHLRRAGERDMAASAWESSVQRHRRVVELLAEIGDADDEIAAEVHLFLGLSLRSTGADGFRPPLLDAARLARRAERADLLARAAIAMMRPGAWYPEAAIVDDDISAMCEAALLMLAADDPLRARVLAALATNLAYDPDVDRRIALVDEAQHLAQLTGDSQLIGTTLVAELLTSRRPDQAERRVEIANEVNRIGRLTGDLDHQITAGIFLIMDALDRAELGLAARLRDELEPVVARQHTYWPEFLIDHIDASLRTVHCDPSADDRIAEVFDTFQHHPVDAFGVWTVQIATRALQEGRMGELLLPLVDMTQSDEADEWSRKWNYAVAKVHMEAGEPERARAAVAANPEPDYDNYWLVSVNNLGAIGFDLGDREMCAQTVEWLTPHRGRLGVIGLGACIGAQISVGLGYAHLGLGDVDLAEELFAEAVEQAVEQRMPYFEAVARRALATAVLARDESDPRVRVELDRVIALADEFGFAGERAGADAVISSIAHAS